MEVLILVIRSIGFLNITQLSKGGVISYIQSRDSILSQVDVRTKLGNIIHAENTLSKIIS